MRNILSYKRGTYFQGKEIQEWAKYQQIYHTSHFKEGNLILKRYPSLSAKKFYMILFPPKITKKKFYTNIQFPPILIVRKK